MSSPIGVPIRPQDASFLEGPAGTTLGGPEGGHRDSAGAGAATAWTLFIEQHHSRLWMSRQPGDQALSTLLQAWRFSLRPGLLTALLGGLEVPDSPDVQLLVGWSQLHFSSPERLNGLKLQPLPDSPQERDRLLLAKVTPLSGSAADRRAAVLCLLSRLGEEYRQREDLAWRQVHFPAHSEDAHTRQILAAVTTKTPDFKAIYAFKKRFASRVRVAFSGVGTLLRLPPAIIQQHAEQAVEQLDMFLLGARYELLSRILETQGEPILSLAGALGPEARGRVDGCVARRETWSQACTLLDTHGGRPDFAQGLAEASELAVFLRLLQGAMTGVFPAHSLGLPGWGVVSANRSRMRGRLRAAAATSPDVLREKTLLLPNLFERTGTALARQALDWAWREARAGFGFDPGRVHPTTCEMEDPSAPVRSRFGPETEPALIALLLLIVGRGCEEDLLQWMAGEPSGNLSKSFYRCLRQAPDLLADPMAPGQRVRRYTGLCEYLAEGGYEALVPVLLPVAQRVCALRPGRNLREQLQLVLTPDWDEKLVPLPGHHLPGFCEAMQRFVQAHATRA